VTNPIQGSEAADPAAVGRQEVYLALPLILLSGLILLAVLTFDRLEWPSFVGDEATYLMAGESLAWDFDLRFEAEDYKRFLDHWGQQPEGLILLSGDKGRHISYGKPFFYPLFIAPFQRLAPVRGPFVANALILVLAGVVAGRSLRGRLGRVAWLWVAVFLFASVGFAYVYWAHADLFLMALSALALSLAFHVRQSSEEPGSVLRWVTVGVLMAIVVFSRPLYLPLLIPIALAVPPRQRRRGLTGLLVGVASVLLLAVTIHWVSGRSTTSYGAQRRGFYSHTGYPGVDFASEQWVEKLEELGDAAWVEGQTVARLPKTDTSLWAWNSLYFLVGRHVGVLPYFLPLLLGILGRPRERAQWALLGAVLLCIAAFFLYRPFNFYGGGGAIANRYFLPLYPAFWFMGSKPARVGPALAVTALAALFLWPLWSQPRSFPLRDDSTYRYVSAAASRGLPFETTQSHLKPSGRSDVIHHQLWVKSLSSSLRPSRDGSVLQLRADSRGQVLIGSPTPLSRLQLEAWGPGAEELDVTRGATVGEAEMVGGVRVLNLDLGRRRARHPMWWTWDPYYLYQLSLRVEENGEGAVSFSLVPPGAAKSGQDDF
jgi:hypothetical protein